MMLGLKAPVGLRTSLPNRSVALLKVSAEPPRKNPAPEAKTVLNDEGPGPQGPGSELLERMAMIGLPMAAALEVTSSKSAEILHTPFVVAAVVGILSAASLIPVIKGTRNVALGFMIPKAQMNNTRAAMIVFAALLLAESQVGAPLI